MKRQFGVEILNDGGRVILTIGEGGKSFEVDILADECGIGVTISRENIILSEAGVDYDEKHINE